MRLPGPFLCACALCLVVFSCGDDSSGGNGQTDTVADTGGDSPGGETTYELTMHFPGDDGELGDPAPDVYIAIDRDSGREEIITGEDGAFPVTLGADEVVSITIAKEGYVVISATTFSQVNADAITADPDGPGLTLIELFDVEEFAANEVNVTLSETGAPAGGSWATSSEAQSWGANEAGRPITETIQASDEPVLITALAWDANNNLYDFERFTLDEATEDTQVQVNFDGEMETDPLSVTVQLDLPDDSSSPLRTENLRTDGPFPLAVFESGTYRLTGGAGNQIVGSDNAFFRPTVEYVPPTDGEAIFLAAAFTTDNMYRSFRYFERDLEEDDVFGILDVPVVSTPTGDADLSASFSWPEIDGAELYSVRIVTPDGAVIWIATSRQASVDLPALPSGYDRTVDWPDDGTEGSFFVLAFQDPDGADADDLDEPLRRNFSNSIGSATPISLGGFPE